MRALLSAGADASARNTSGSKPLMAAVGSRDAERICALLIDKGASTGVRDRSGRSARDHAERLGKHDLGPLQARVPEALETRAIAQREQEAALARHCVDGAGLALQGKDAKWLQARVQQDQVRR